MKFIITTEFGETYIANDITDGDLSASNDGVITIVDVTDGTIHVGGEEWPPLDHWENQ